MYGDLVLENIEIDKKTLQWYYSLYFVFYETSRYIKNDNVYIAQYIEDGDNDILKIVIINVLKVVMTNMNMNININNWCLLMKKKQKKHDRKIHKTIN